MTKHDLDKLPKLVETDDGSAVFFSSYTGGSHPSGAWGEISLIFVAPNGALEHVRYIRQRPNPTEPQV